MKTSKKPGVITYTLAALLVTGMAWAFMQPSKPDPENISKATFQGEWPFTVEKGRVYCTHKGELVFVANGNGVHYALNGVAQKSYDPVDAIWKAKGATKVSVSDVIQHAQKFCD